MRRLEKLHEKEKKIIGKKRQKQVKKIEKVKVGKKSGRWRSMLLDGVQSKSRKTTTCFSTCVFQVANEDEQPLNI